MLTSLLILSPLEQFEVVPLVSLSFPVLGYVVVSLTNLALYAIMAVSLLVALHVTANNSYRLVPSSWSVALEASVATLTGIVRDQLGTRHEAYTPLLYSLFTFILVCNLLGNVPYGYTVTTSAVACLGLSLLVFFAVTILGLYTHGVHFFSFFVPAGTPLALVPMLVVIELVSYLARAASLGVRLFSNMAAGHTLLKILATFLGQLFTSSVLVAVVTLVPYAVFVALVGLELAVSLIQAFVATVLTASYLKDALELH
jgi:F-type H+-transporting ATPase subunit a